MLTQIAILGFCFHFITIHYDFWAKKKKSSRKVEVLFSSSKSILKKKEAIT